MIKTYIKIPLIIGMVLTLNSCGMSKLIQVKPMDSAQVDEIYKSATTSAQQQVDYAMQILKNKDSYLNSLQDYPINGKKGDDLKNEISKFTPEIAEKIAPKLNELVSKIDDLSTLTAVNSAGSFANYLKGSKYEMELRIAIEDAIKSRSLKLSTNVNPNSTEDILRSIYYIMNQKTK